MVVQANRDSRAERLLTKLEPLLAALGYDNPNALPQV